MNVGKVMAFHSYKGGTGKTTLVANLASISAMMGKKVCLLDFDLYAPSLCTYFNKETDYYINNLLSGEAELTDILIDITQELNTEGELYLGLASPKKDDIHNIEIKHDMKWQLAALRKFLRIKRELFSEYNFDYVFLDTSPGIRYWSINALAAADILFLLMKVNDMDIEGTRNMIHEIYDSLTRFGTKNYLLLNKVPGASPLDEFNEEEGIGSLVGDIENIIGIPVMGSIPCYCDIQFNRHEYLYSITNMDHPFSQKMHELAKIIL